VLGQEIRKARVAAGLTQEELAARARLTREYVSLLELNKRMPTMPVYVRICRSLGVSPSKLLSILEDWLAKPGNASKK
jgi:transcriptional regulator with XRE-family HTH domain